jgi:hypothetical protein
MVCKERDKRQKALLLNHPKAIGCVLLGGRALYPVFGVQLDTFDSGTIKSMMYLKDGRLEAVTKHHPFRFKGTSWCNSE